MWKPRILGALRQVKEGNYQEFGGKISMNAAINR